MNINSFFLNNKSIDLLNNWVNYDYKNKFLFIYGNVSSGKTSLAEILLKNYKIISINIDFFKEKSSLTDFLNLSLGKKNISMMFNKNYQYNSIIFDNLELFLKHNKHILNDIINYIPKLQNYKKNHPIIFISSNINHKYFKKILKYCSFVEINYTYDNIKSITNNILKNKNIKLIEIELIDLINKSDKKINNIKSNIEILNLNDKKQDIYDYEDNFTSNILDKIYKSNNYSDIIRYSHCINNLYLDILDNIHYLTDDIDVINKVYKTCCLSENVNTYYIKNHIDLSDFFILLSVIYPKYCLNEINLKKIINNKYVSKSLIYISNNKNINNNNYDINILHILNTIKDDNFINFIKDKYNINDNDLKKINNVYSKIINL